ncbi:hypothetical protein [Tenggerimyces flavus]|uniref:Uncharacterized protein n=1 Tax=Tenggerimyces flavus TaxID=1708749 RepID=A0ABV7Y9P3_9ACTN|nr:hypothetical protein [Tenggerimyces flavus]MBM7785203.1 hypothetical protein [Tenggerimyces flavus]
MDEMRVKDELRSYVVRDEPPMGITAPGLVARGRSARGRRNLALAAAGVAATVGLATVGLPLLTQGRVSIDPAGLIKTQNVTSLDEQMDELIRSNVPHGDEFELLRIKAYRWDKREALAEDRQDEATRWTATYLYNADSRSEAQLRVELKYVPSKQWPERSANARPDEPDIPPPTMAILSMQENYSMDARAVPEPGPPAEPGYIVEVGVANGTPSLDPPPDRFTWADQVKASTDPQLVFDRPATWPPDVVAP